MSIRIKSSADYTYYRKVISFGDFSMCPENSALHKNTVKKSASSFTFTDRNKVQLHEGL